MGQAGGGLLSACSPGGVGAAQETYEEKCRFDVHDEDDGLDGGGGGGDGLRESDSVSAAAAGGGGGGAAAVLGRDGFKVLTQREVESRQQAAVSDVVELLDVDRDDALLLLRCHAWSLDRLSEAFFADPTAARRSAGVWDPSAAGAEGPPRAVSSSLASSLCGICFADPPIELLPCGHSSYCSGCWAQYVKTAVEDGKGCLGLECPTGGCGTRLRPSDFRQLCAGELLERYKRFEVESFVEGNPDYAWCPGPRCDLAVHFSAAAALAGDTPQLIQCSCGTQWCAGCKSDAHLPVTCAVVKEWTARCKDAVASWISANTKPCPKCSNPIEKNGGCMHMTCRKPGGCGHEFCWLCLGDWKVHGQRTGGYYQCNRYQNKESAKHEEERAQQLRYEHYLTRFQEHERAQRFAATDQRKALSEVEGVLLKSRGLEVKYVEFLGDAVGEIVACRRFLKWTYAHAFVAKFTKQKRDLFEINQALLECTLERLSDVMENTDWKEYLDRADASTRSFEEVRTQVISLVHVLRGAFSSMATAITSSAMDAGIEA